MNDFPKIVVNVMFYVFVLLCAGMLAHGLQQSWEHPRVEQTQPANCLPQEP